MGDTRHNVLMSDSAVARRQAAENTPPNPTGEKQSWPAWYFGPDGAQAIYQNSDEVPAGWEDHPDKVKGSPAAKAAAKAKAKQDDEFKDMSDGDVMKALDEAKVDYKTDMPRDKLIALLKASKDK